MQAFKCVLARRVKEQTLWAKVKAFWVEREESVEALERAKESFRHLAEIGDEIWIYPEDAAFACRVARLFPSLSTGERNWEENFDPNDPRIVY